ncbi:RHS repeat-associated core domain-containing protein [Pseudomonas sp. NPDC087336]|uniref:RHS repeat-associated core domain-containing protein n=1 Tax=Pseudomonas sp. NPDC087336 TaxID=3364436 RepID=UPI0038294A2C
MPISPRETLLCRYRYDPLDRSIDWAPGQQASIQRFYCKSRLATEIQGAAKYSFLQHDEQVLAQQRQVGDNVDTTLLATDQQRSVLNALDTTQPHPRAYSPYGHHPFGNGVLSLLGFNGERPDPVTGHYHLGNGYRQFNPRLMRFNSPDSLSPFGKGGLNAYMYCGANPINRSDPTGHFALSPKMVNIAARAILIAPGAILGLAGTTLLSIGAGAKDEKMVMDSMIIIGTASAYLVGVVAFTQLTRKLPVRPPRPSSFTPRNPSTPLESGGLRRPSTSSSRMPATFRNSESGSSTPPPSYRSSWAPAPDPELPSYESIELTPRPNAQPPRYSPPGSTPSEHIGDVFFKARENNVKAKNIRRPT